MHFLNQSEYRTTQFQPHARTPVMTRPPNDYFYQKDDYIYRHRISQHTVRASIHNSLKARDNLLRSVDLLPTRYVKHIPNSKDSLYYSKQKGRRIDRIYI